MITVILKDANDKAGSVVTSFSDRLQKSITEIEIENKTPKQKPKYVELNTQIAKKLAKEFSCSKDDIYTYWLSEDQ